MGTTTQSAVGYTKVECSDERVVDTDPTTARKRRRRAAASGAADDCFACQERRSSCDRRRPYCSQCLQIGNDCSGYKTVLTWGVGVASRGKLRGLALPIAKSKKVEPSTDTSPNAITNPPVPTLAQRRLSTNPPKDPKFVPRSVPPGIQSQPTHYGIFAGESQASSMLPSPSPQLQASPPRKRRRRHSLEPVQVSPMPNVQTHICMTAKPAIGYSDQDQMISPLTPCFPSCDPCSSMYLDFSSLDYKSMQEHGVLMGKDKDSYFGYDASSWPRGSICSTKNSDTDHRTDEEQPCVHSELVKPLDDTLETQRGMSIGVSGASLEHQTSREPDTLFGYSTMTPPAMDDFNAHASVSLLAQQVPSPRIGNTPKLRFLIDYYDRVISPVIVAFDGPTNPYRTHILQLAVQSQTLQHAIAALSASNFRMRRAQNHSEPRRRNSTTDCTYDASVRKSSVAYRMMSGGQAETLASKPSPEELYHKSESIKGLNQQLSEPTARKDDSILATLLMLCLYHICDTGVAKFQTQFAGVKKILALRGGTSGKNSKASNWLTIMFTWFDAMTASVNDRECHLSGDDVDMSAFENEDWALENLAGCDSRLFMIIAKLGRLNLLSQSKKVRPSASVQFLQNQKRSSSLTAMTVPAAGNIKSLDYYSMSAPRYDGNGFSQLLTDEDLPHDPNDNRTHFWTEWKAIRRALQDWQLDTATLHATMLPRCSPIAQGDRFDLLHISESFRYSALLYTERLAFPHLPSSHPNFSNLVGQALTHISNVQTDVFLLWPLFITGTECVSLEGRTMIRERCMDIQRDSGFFNNITGLELLEKIWRQDDSCVGGEACNASSYGINGDGAGRCGVNQGFKWRTAMERKGEEYIVV